MKLCCGARSKRRSGTEVHVDLEVADVAATVSRAVTHGATRLGGLGEDGIRWTTLTDPGCNEFDIVAAG
jgi:hypothetical protein